jgi:hypothetical protein
MISSPTGKSVQDALYPAITPYMYYHAATLPNGAPIDKIDRYIKTYSNTEMICQREEEFKTLMNLINNIEDINTVEQGFWIFKTNVKTVDLFWLKDKLKKYKAVQDEYLKKINDLNVPDENSKVSIQANGKAEEVTFNELLMTDYDYLISDQIQLIKFDKSAAARREREAILNLYKAARVKKNEFVKDPKFAANVLAKKNLIDGIFQDARLTDKSAFSIQREVALAYDAYYKNISKTKLEEKNPCKDFVI